MTAPTRQRVPEVVIENCRILFRNFSGAEGKYNKAGDRNFCVLIDPETADAMSADGWYIRELQAREEGDLPQPYLKVKVKYGGKGQPPRVILITSRGKTPLDESMVNILDWAEITNVDLIVRPYHYDVSGRQGISAYLKAIYVTIREDELEQKYADTPEVPDSAQSSIKVHEGEDKPPWDE